MLSRTGTLHLQRPLDHAINTSLDFLALLRIFGVVHDGLVEITVSNVPKNTREEAQIVHLLLANLHNLRQPRHGNRNIRRPDFLVALAESKHAPQTLLASGPQGLLLVLVDGELELAAAVLFGDLTDLLDVLGHGGRRPAELEEQRRRLGPLLPRRPRAVDDVHLHLVHDLHGGDGDAAAHHFGARRGAVADRRERAHSHGRLLRDHGELEGDFGHDAQSPFTADEKPREIVACGGFPWTAPGFDHATVGEHYC